LRRRAPRAAQTEHACDQPGSTKGKKGSTKGSHRGASWSRTSDLSVISTLGRVALTCEDVTRQPL